MIKISLLVRRIKNWIGLLRDGVVLDYLFIWTDLVISNFLPLTLSICSQVDVKTETKKNFLTDFFFTFCRKFFFDLLSTIFDPKSSFRFFLISYFRFKSFPLFFRKSKKWEKLSNRFLPFLLLICHCFSPLLPSYKSYLLICFPSFSIILFLYFKQKCFENSFHC